MVRLAIVLLVSLVALGFRAPPPTLAARVAPEAAAPSAVQAQLRPVRMGLIPTIVPSPFYIAIERGYAAAEGIDLQLETVQITTDALTQVGAGNLEVANVTLGAAVLNSLVRGVTIKIISGNDGYPPEGPGGNPFLVRKDLYDAGLTDASGLRGRKVAGNSLGVFTEYAIDRVLRTGGLTIDDVEFVQMPFPDIPVALANRAVDAGFVVEPSGTVAMNQGSAVRIVPDFGRGAQQTLLMAGPTLLRDPALIESYLRAWMRGLRDVLSEGFTPEIAAIIEKYTRVPASLVQQVNPPYWDPEGRVNWDSLMDQQRFYMARGSATYREPLNLQQVLSEDGPRQAALASLNR